MGTPQFVFQTVKGPCRFCGKMRRCHETPSWMRCYWHAPASGIPTLASAVPVHWVLIRRSISYLRPLYINSSTPIAQKIPFTYRLLFWCQFPLMHLVFGLPCQSTLAQAYSKLLGVAKETDLAWLVNIAVIVVLCSSLFKEKTWVKSTSEFLLLPSVQSQCFATD